MNPINYLQNQPDLGTSLMESIQLGNAVRQARQGRQQEQEAEAYKTELKTALGSNDPKSFAALAVKYPKQGAGLKQAWEMLSEEQRKAELGAGQNAWYAINSGRPDVAIGIVDEQVTAMKNAGKDPAKLTALRAAIERDPGRASQTLSMFLSTVAPKEFAENLTKLGAERRNEEDQPAKLEKLRAEADEHKSKAASAAVAARFAESNAVEDLKKKGWDITKIQEDIKTARENSRIALMNVAIGKERNAINRDELKLKRDEAVAKRDEHVRTQAAEVTTARNGIDNFLNTADKIIGTPLNVMNSAMGPTNQRLPTVFQSTADFEALMENFDAQAFISQLPSMKGLGALSDAEGKRLSSALQSFSLKQSPPKLLENVKEAQRLMQKARKNIATRYGVPDNIPDTPAAAKSTTPEEVQAILKQYAPQPTGAVLP